MELTVRFFFLRVGAITKNKIEKKVPIFFFNFLKFGSVGSVKRKIKELWPNKLSLILVNAHSKCVVLVLRFMRLHILLVCLS